MLGFQAEGAAPIVTGQRVENPETIATAIRIGNPASWQGALQAATESGGSIDSVTDDEILADYQHLARREGILCEPASAASVAGLLMLSDRGTLGVPDGSTIVCTLTGHGLKDPERAVAGVDLPLPIPAERKALLEHLEAT